MGAMTTRAATAPDGRERELGRRLRELIRVTKLLRQHRSDHRPLIPAGLLGVLRQIREETDGDAAGRPKELARRTGLDPSTVSRAAATLVSLGLVERRPDPRDGRAALLVVTDAGRAAEHEAAQWYADVLRDALTGWRPEDVDALTGGIARLVTDLERTATDAGRLARNAQQTQHLRALEAAP